MKKTAHKTMKYWKLLVFVIILNIGILYIYYIIRKKNIYGGDVQSIIEYKPYIIKSFNKSMEMKKKKELLGLSSSRNTPNGTYLFKSNYKLRTMKYDRYEHFGKKVHKRYMTSNSITKIFHQSWKKKNYTSTSGTYLFTFNHKSGTMKINRYEYFDSEVHKRYMTSNNITKIIHRSWKNKQVPKNFKQYYKSWKKCFPTWEHKFWTDEDNRDFILKHYPWFLAKYDSFPQPIYKADCARYVYMHHYGGIYTDLDNECLYPFEHLLSNYSLVFGDIDFVPNVTLFKENYVQNSFMYSRPNHPFWLELLIMIRDSKVKRTADIITGPVVLSNMIHKYRLRYSNTHNIKIYEGRYFNPMTWGQQDKNPKFCKIYNKMSDQEYIECRNFYLKKGSYVVQYHSHVWG